MAQIPGLETPVYPLCFGGNVFGWSANERESFEVLDAFAAAGGNFIDTADAYSYWVPGHQGGESETILGRWLASRKNRAKMIIATKVGMLESLKGLRASTIATAVERSLERLGVEAIDLYYAHRDDPETPLEETMQAFDALVKAGKVRALGASNYTADRLESAIAICKREGFAPFRVLQPHYNLLHRKEYEGALAALCAREGITCAPYFALARGFLTGKYRPGVEVTSVRKEGAMQYLNDHGLRVLAVLDELAAHRATTPAAVAIAWLRQQPTVLAPIASARNKQQWEEIAAGATLELSKDEVGRLSKVSEAAG